MSAFNAAVSQAAEKHHERQESNANLGFLPPGKKQCSKGDNLSLEMNLLHPSEQGCGDGDPTHQQHHTAPTWPGLVVHMGSCSVTGVWREGWMVCGRPEPRMGREEGMFCNGYSSLRPALVLKAVQEAQQDSPIQLLGGGKTSWRSQATSSRSLRASGLTARAGCSSDVCRAHPPHVRPSLSSHPAPGGLGTERPQQGQLSSSSPQSSRKPSACLTGRPREPCRSPTRSAATS